MIDTKECHPVGESIILSFFRLPAGLEYGCHTDYGVYEN